MDVIKVKSNADFSLSLLYADGEQRVFDMRPLLTMKPWDRIASPAIFLQATVAYGTVVWPGGVDIAPETLYLKSVAVAESVLA